MKPFLFAAMLASMVYSLRAQERVTLSQVQGKTGELHVQLTERSPLSTLAEMAKRMSTKLDPSAKDYDLSAQDFYVYVPRSPGDDGKYGLVCTLPFADAHGFTPVAQREVLEKLHLIWVAPMHGGDEAPAQQRIGELVDAVYNARKAWPISDHRVYAFITTNKSPEQGSAIYYADQFSGVIMNVQLIWFRVIRDPKTTVGVPISLPLARPESIAAAKKLPVFVIADSGVDPQTQRLQELVVREGYLAADFKHVKRLPVQSEKRNLWSNYTGDWFEEGIAYLDSLSSPVGVANASRTTAASTKSSSGAASTSKPSSPGGGKEEQASSALSLAKSYVSSQRWALARTKLQKIVEEFPGTKAAEEAKKLLEEIKDK